MPCQSCGNPNPAVIAMGGGFADSCELCDPLMHVPPRPDFICPHNDIYCMWEYREGHRGFCACWGNDVRNWKGDTAFCTPNRTLIESLKNGSSREFNRLVGILTSEKMMKKYFHHPARIDYKVVITK